MKVNELMEQLSKCSPTATVCVEAYRDCLAKVVQEYELIGGTRVVYIADELDYVDNEICGKKVKEKSDDE